MDERGFMDPNEFDHPTDVLPMPTLLDPSEDPESAVTEEFRGGVVEAARAILALATGDESISRKQFDAAKYVVERVIGTVKDGRPMGEGDPFDKLLMRINADKDKVAAELKAQENAETPVVEDDE